MQNIFMTQILFWQVQLLILAITLGKVTKTKKQRAVTNKK